jgi:protein SCO1/2
VCSLFLLVLNCNTPSKELPILSYKIDASGNQNFYNITYEGFTNQLGNSFSTEDIQNKICIANFFFTRCPSICPPMRTELISIAEAFSENENVMFISHTIDPKHDSIPVLKGYSEATGIPNSKWQFIRASEEQTKLQAATYMTNFKPNEDGSDFYHSSFVALVDQKQHIRGFYNVLIKEDVERLKTDIQSLF